jgi:hypothetical protein
VAVDDNAIGGGVDGGVGLVALFLVLLCTARGEFRVTLMGRDSPGGTFVVDCLEGAVVDGGVGLVALFLVLPCTARGEFRVTLMGGDSSGGTFIVDCLEGAVACLIFCSLAAGATFFVT